jgi:tetratricopeptide (TPR) repeat protein
MSARRHKWLIIWSAWWILALIVLFVLVPYVLSLVPRTRQPLVIGVASAAFLGGTALIFLAGRPERWRHYLEENQHRERQNLRRLAAIEQAAIDRLRLTLGEEHHDTLNRRLGRAELLRKLDRPEEALAEIRAVLDIRRRVLGVDHPDVQETYVQLITTLTLLGRHHEARAAEASYVGDMQALVAAKQRTVAEVDVELQHEARGLEFAQQRQWSQAEAEYRALYALRRTRLGDDDPETIQTHEMIGFALGQQERWAEAAAEYRSVLDAQRKVLGDDHPDTVRTRQRLAAVTGES